MLSRLNTASRIPLLRPLRPPNLTPTNFQPRLFTQNAQLLLVAPRVARSRPQLPYLSQSSFHPPQPSYIQGQVSRLLSTETKAYVKKQAWLSAQWTVIITLFSWLGTLSWLGYQDLVAESKNPTPEEWSWRSRAKLRDARKYIAAGEERGFVDWVQIGGKCKTLLERLEDPNIDGKDLADRDEGGLLIPGVGKAGYDISAKPWPWRLCYFEAIMGCAAAAEHMSEMVLDTTQNIMFPREYMVGPSNPFPRPVAAWMPAAPLEENCADEAFDAPETFYFRILTGAGFTTQQKLDAAFAYGNWLNYKGLGESATEAYKWGVDIAKAEIPGDTSAVIDDKQVLQAQGTSKVTPNLARAATEYAIQEARTGNISAALPILLSVLRARRAAPIGTERDDFEFDQQEQRSRTDIGASLQFLKNIFTPPAFPPLPRTDDLPITRSSEKPTCEESELMLYIGEILFATSGDAKEGIDWTRQAVTIAEANLQTKQIVNKDMKATTKTVNKCKECLLVGTGNWETMLTRLSEDGAARKGGRGWNLFGTRSNGLAEESIAEELKRVEKLKHRIIHEGIAETLARQKGNSVFFLS